jgi:hypothetical protein
VARLAFTRLFGSDPHVARLPWPRVKHSDIGQIWSSSRYPTLESRFPLGRSHSKIFLERNRRYVIYLE